MSSRMCVMYACAATLVACGTSSSPSPSPGPSPSASPSPAPESVPLPAARFTEGDVAAELGQKPDRSSACMQLGVFDSSETDPCAPGLLRDATAPTLAAPWTSADVIALRRSENDEADETACSIIIGVNDAAYVARRWISPCDDGEFTRAAATWTVDRGALVLTLVREDHERIDRAFQVVETATLRVACTVDAAGAPSCTPATVVSKTTP